MKTVTIFSAFDIIKTRLVLPVPVRQCHSRTTGTLPLVLPLVAFARMFLAGISSVIQGDSGSKAQSVFLVFNVTGQDCRNDRISGFFRQVLVCAISFVVILNGIVHSQDNTQFIRRHGSTLVVGADEQVIFLRGINFNNFSWSESGSEIINSNHHSEIDFQRVADMRMNTIRLNLNYVIFEDDSLPYVYKQEGWNWLDKNIGWAKMNGVYLILDMHVPQGGYQGSSDAGLALWTDTENQNRLKALWKAIAERYKDETIIAAWDLINEPTPQNQQQWYTLSQELINEIRSADQNHLIIVEATANADYSLLYNMLVDDDNVMYDGHFYVSTEYTHQYTYFTGMADGGKYPDADITVLPLWLEPVFVDMVENPKVPPGYSNWTFYEGNLYKVTNNQIISGIPTFYSGKNEGAVYFDDFVINEYDENQNFVRQIMSIDIENLQSEEYDKLSSINPYVSHPIFWFSWSEDGSGTGEPAQIGHRGNSSFAISGVTNVYTLSSRNLTFAVKQGYSYQVSGWMKGVGVSNESNHITIRFEKMPEEDEYTPFDKSHLIDMLSYFDFGITYNVPMNIGEFGLSKWCFDNDKGGLTWVRDLLELFDERGFSFQYWDYHSWDFGLYQNREGLPDPNSTNQELIDLFTGFLTSVNAATIPETIQNGFSLLQNYPNPFNNKTTIKFNLQGTSRVVLKIYNLFGQEIKTLMNEFQSGGEKTISWDGSNKYGQPVSSSIYIYQIKTESLLETKKMILIN